MRKVAKKSTPDQTKKHAELYLSGFSVQEVADFFDKSYGVIRRSLLREKVEFQPIQKAPEQIANLNNIVNLYESGLNALQIGEMCGCSNETIRRKLKSLGVERRVGGGIYRSNARPQHVIDNIVNLYNSGNTLKQIGEKVDLSFQQISVILKDSGVQMRSRTYPKK